MTSNVRKISTEDAEALLVFLANETLQGEERAAVEAAVAADPDLQTQLQALQKLRCEMRSTAPLSGPGEAGMERLLDAVQEGPRSRFQGMAASNSIWKWTAALAVAVCLGQAILSGSLRDVNILRATDCNAGHTGPTLVVAFSETATETGIRSLLLDLDLSIVQGPTPLGVYTLRAVDDASHLVALNAMQDLPAVIESANAGS